MKKVLVWPADKNGSGIYRLIEPYSKIKHKNISFELNTSTEIDDEFFDEKAAQYDGIILQRPCDISALRKFRNLQARGVKIVIDSDDYISGISPSHPNYEYFMNIKLGYMEYMAMADYLHCTTDKLKDNLHYPEKTIVFPNAIDLNHNYDKPTARYTLRRAFGVPVGVPVVMWGGSPSHAETYPILRRIRSAVPDLYFVFVSNKNMLELNGIRENELTKIIDYTDFDIYRTIPAIADVFITPLEFTRFCECKSELKVLEASVWGVPVISTEIFPYMVFNQACRGNILIRKNKIDMWAKAIRRTIENKTDSAIMVNRAKQGLHEHYSLEKINHRRAMWWESIL